jgi:hypothetical protein
MALTMGVRVTGSACQQARDNTISHLMFKSADRFAFSVVAVAGP